MIIVAILTTACAAFFCGTAVYVSLVEHPVRVKLGMDFALREFQASFPRVRNIQVALVAIAVVGSAVAGCGLHQWLWWLGCGLMLLNLPYTYFALMGINTRLLKMTEKDGTAAEQLLVMWGRRHVVRDAISFAATLLFLFALSSR